MPTILITGAASGLGAAFLETYSAQQPTTKILALDRNPIILPKPNPNIHPHTLDLTHEPALQSFAREIASEPINLVIHCAGIRGLVPSLEDAFPGDVGACETLGGMDVGTLMRSFEINAVGTFLLLRALVPSLVLAAEEGEEGEEGGNSPKVIVMSSRMGSLANNSVAARPGSAGSAYAYRASKAALNMLVRSFAVDVPRVVFVLCHPGRVETGLVRGREEGAIEAAESVGGLVPLIEGWGRGDSGGFYDRFGEVIEW